MNAKIDQHAQVIHGRDNSSHKLTKRFKGCKSMPLKPPKHRAQSSSMRYFAIEYAVVL